MKQRIESLLRHALEAAVADGELALDEIPTPFVERPRDPSHGDWATNVAMQLAKPAKLPPRRIAEIISDRIAEDPDVAAVEIAGPGFINLRLSGEALRGVLREAREQGPEFGHVDIGQGTKVQVEFVSANPVGPMHVGHGRWAALGDSLARVLEATGYKVEREFYINDAGVQMDIFAKSVAGRYLELAGPAEVEFGEDWYRGAYITDIAREILDADGHKWVGVPAAEREAAFKERAYAQVLEHLKKVLHDMGVDFDVWFSERTLHEPGPDGKSAIDRVIEKLRGEGYIYDHEGAVWFRTTTFGDDKDRVLKKADGSYTYFAADIAYHENKLERGFELIVDIWGADHHGYVRRMEAAVCALGSPGALEVIIGQLVNLFRNGEVVRMSKRTGEMVTFEDLIDEVGDDAARYFFLRRSTDQALDFDIGLAKEQSADNPVYYVQYAHARICSILRKAAGRDTADETADIAAIAAARIPADAPLELLDSDAELTLLRKLAELPEVVEATARGRAPHRLTAYAEDLAATFHRFYTLCRVVSEDEALTAARLFAVDATRIALANVLGLIGVNAPQRM